MIPVSSTPSLPAFLTPEAGFDYFATEAHYRSLAGRIISALGGFSVVVVTEDPSASAPSLAAALTEAAGSRYTVIGLSYGSELGHRDVPHLRRALSASLARGGVAGEAAAPASPLIVFDHADQLSDEQIEEIFKSLYPRTRFDERQIAAAVLRARAEFLARLERPVLRFWLAKRLLVARLRFQELGVDEVPVFIRHQLGSDQAEDTFTPEAMTAIANVSGGDPIVVNRFSRRLLDFAAATTADRLVHAAPAPAALAPVNMPSEERSITNLDEPPTRTRRGGMVLKLSAGAVCCLACVGVTVVLLMHPAEEKIAASGTPVTEAAVTIPEGGSSPGEAVPSAADPTGSATSRARSLPDALAGSAAEPAPTDASASAEGTPQETASPVTTPAPEVTPPAGTPTTAEILSTGSPGATPTVLTTPTPPPRLSAAEITSLLARGDRIFAQRDIASARLFYERAADAGDGQAALKLAKTFDPVFLYFAHLNTVRGDAGMAAYWYRRARDLGEAEAR